MKPQSHRLLVLWSWVLLGLSGTQAFHSGDFIQTARKAQFHAHRTQWHDLIGDSCPRFGRSRLVVVTLPKPSAPLQELDEYKVQFSFDGDRHLTQWFKLTGQESIPVPTLHITLKRSGEELLGVTGEVVMAPMHLQHNDPSYATQWNNNTHWPKRLLVRYAWATHTDVDLDRGLVVLLIIGVVMLVILGTNTTMGAGPKLAQFVTDIVADLDTDLSMSAGGALPGGKAGGSSGGGPGQGPAAPLWKGGGKAE